MALPLQSEQSLFQLRVGRLRSKPDGKDQLGEGRSGNDELLAVIESEDGAYDRHVGEGHLIAGVGGIELPEEAVDIGLEGIARVWARCC